MASKIIIAFISIIFLGGCKTNAEKKQGSAADTSSTDKPVRMGELPDARYTVTDHSFGLVPLDADYETLVRTYGKERVTDELMYRAPDTDEQVTKTLINRNASDEIVIQWDDKAFHKKILAIESYRPNHPFKTATGIHYGTTLAELVQINGAKISFSGFGWDFGGLITDLHKGKLSTAPGTPIISFSLDLNTTQQYPEILGDQVLDTEMPAVKKYLDNIVVRKIELLQSVD